MNNWNRFAESSKNSCNILSVFQVIPIPSFSFQLIILLKFEGKFSQSFFFGGKKLIYLFDDKTYLE